MRLRYRDCDVPGECEGTPIEVEECNVQKCDGEWILLGSQKSF